MKTKSHWCTDFLKTQLKNRTKNNWVTTVLRDLEELELNVNFDEIKGMKKAGLVNLLRQSIVDKSLKELNKTKESHSKVMGLKHEYLKMKRHFLHSDLKASKEEIHLVFKLRSRVTNLKTNLKGMYESFECTVCGNAEESQKHVLECKELLKWNKEIKEKLFMRILLKEMSVNIYILQRFLKKTCILRIKEMMKNEK